MRILNDSVFMYFLLMTSFIAVTWGAAKLANTNKPIEVISKNISIEGLRGFLALGVFFHHALIHFNFSEQNVWKAPESNFYALIGQFSVAFFFVITAYLFTVKILNTEQINWTILYESRVKRIVPLYLVTTVALVLIVLIKSNHLNTLTNIEELRKIFAWFAFGLYGYPDLLGVKSTFTVNAGVFWTLYYEWIFYICLPFLAYSLQAKSKALIIILLLVLILLSESKFLYFFVSGIVAAIAETRFKKSINTYVALSSVLTLTVLFFVNFNNAYGFIQAIISFFIFICILKSKNPFLLFDNKGSQWLGKISYSIYMLHGLCLTVFFMLLQQQKIKLNYEYYWLYVFVLGLVVIAVSSITYLYIEKRFMLKNNVPT